MYGISNLAIYIVTAIALVALGLQVAGRATRGSVGAVWGAAAVVALAIGLWLGLIWAPPDLEMGQVQRIMYVHFPSWVGAGAAFTTAFAASLLYLLRRNPRYDYWAHAGVEVGLVFCALGMITGSLWGRPTWGIWWTWDPRLTSTAVMFVTFLGYLSLRAFVEDPDSRARFAAVVAIIAFVNLPIVYMSVQWWRTLHQVQSSPDTVDIRMVMPLRTMMLAFFLLCGWMLTRRYDLARLRGDAERRFVEPEATA